MSNGEPSKNGFADLSVAMQQCFAEQMKGVWTMLPGVVETFSPTTQRAKVKLVPAAELADGRVIPHPSLVGVPVQFPRFGGYCLTMPVVAGDQVAVFFSSRSLDRWLIDGDCAKAPQRGRFFSLSDAFAVPGLTSGNRPIPAFSMAAAALRDENGSVAVSLTSGGQIVANAGASSLTINQSGAIVAATPVGTMTLSPTGQFTVTNAAGELNAITQAMLQILVAAVPPAQLSAYNSLLAQRATFL